MAGVAEPSFTCLISTDKQSYKSGEEVKLFFKLTNINKQDLYVLKWHTPLEDFRNNFLKVKHDGKDLMYLGIMAKRGNPGAESYVLVSSGESVEAEVVLNKAYDVVDPGHYTVELQTKLMDVLEKQEGEEMVPRKLGSMQCAALSCDPVQFDIMA